MIRNNNIAIENITSEFLSMIKLPEANGKKLSYLFVLPFGVRADDTYRLPVGFALVTAALKASGRNVSTLNLNYKHEPIELLKNMINKNDIDVVLTGGLSVEYWNIKTVIDAAKEAKSEIIAVVGGGIITADPAAAMEALESADYGIIGEGEITVNALAHALENDYDPAMLDGVICFRDGGWSVRDDWPMVHDLDILPFPDYEGFDYSSLLAQGKLSNSMPKSYSLMETNNVSSICISRSCPFNCTFCFHTCGNTYRRMSLDHTFKLLDWLLSLHCFDALSLHDEMTFSDLEYALEFCRRIKPYNLQWKCFIHASFVKGEMLVAMKESGCVIAVMGIESADNGILKSMRKNINIKRVGEILDFASQIDLTVVGSLIFGDTEETMESVLKSLNWREAHRDLFRGKNIINLAKITAFPGSHLYKVACERNIINDRVQFLKDGCPPVNVSKLSQEEYNVMLTALFGIYGPPNKLKDAQIEPRTDFTVNINGFCPHCSSIVGYSCLYLVMTSPQICPTCGKDITVNPIEHCDFGKLSKNAAALLDGKGAAIWAITLNNFYWLLNLIPPFSESNLKIINSDEILCIHYFGRNESKIISTEGKELFCPPKSAINPGKVVLVVNKEERLQFPSSSPIKALKGKAVHTPDIIRKESIDTVIVPNSPHVFQSIKEQCAAEFPSVKRIVHITELL